MRYRTKMPRQRRWRPGLPDPLARITAKLAHGTGSWPAPPFRFGLTQQSASRATLPAVSWPGLARPPTSFLAASGKVVDGRPSPTMTHYQLSPYLPTAEYSNPPDVRLTPSWRAKARHPRLRGAPQGEVVDADLRRHDVEAVRVSAFMRAGITRTHTGNQVAPDPVVLTQGVAVSTATKRDGRETPPVRANSHVTRHHLTHRPTRRW
jgi:hypothetical protein